MINFNSLTGYYITAELLAHWMKQRVEAGEDDISYQTLMQSFIEMMWGMLEDDIRAQEKRLKGKTEERKNEVN